MCPPRSPRCGTPSGIEVAFYFDTSALVKLVIAEPETSALRGWISEADRGPVACDLVRTELYRAIRRTAPDRLIDAHAVLANVTMYQLSAAIFEDAARLNPPELRSLDAIHIAAALDMGDDLDGIVTYDERLAAAAAANGIRVFAPS